MFRYISWVEQEYPKGGKEGNIPTLIESCIRKFKDDKTVHNDPRFVEIWLKYAAISSKPLEVFDFMYNNGLCTQKAEMYEAWARDPTSVHASWDAYFRGINYTPPPSLGMYVF